MEACPDPAEPGPTNDELSEICGHPLAVHSFAGVGAAACATPVAQAAGSVMDDGEALPCTIPVGHRHAMRGPAEGLAGTEVAGVPRMGAAGDPPDPNCGLVHEELNDVEAWLGDVDGDREGLAEDTDAGG